MKKKVNLREHTKQENMENLEPILQMTVSWFDKSEVMASKPIVQASC